MSAMEQVESINLIPRLREAHQWTQGFLATKLTEVSGHQWDQSKVSRLEHKPDGEIAVQEARWLAQIFGVDPEVFLYPENVTWMIGFKPGKVSGLAAEDGAKDDSTTSRVFHIRPQKKDVPQYMKLPARAA